MHGQTDSPDVVKQLKTSDFHGDEDTYCGPLVYDVVYAGEIGCRV